MSTPATTATITAALTGQEFPATQAPIASYQFTITSSVLASPMVLDCLPGTTPVAVTTAVLVPGDYSVSAGQVDASGNVIGTPVTGSFSVAAAAPVTLQVISSVSTVVA